MMQLVLQIYLIQFNTYDNFPQYLIVHDNKIKIETVRPRHHHILQNQIRLDESCALQSHIIKNECYLYKVGKILYC